jgi:hypothetical protein
VSALLVVMGWARAQEPAPAEPAPAEPAPAEPAAEEITVWAERVEAAREVVVQEIEELGYTRNVRERDGKTVFVHEEGWKGKVVLYDDGRLATRRTGLSGREMQPIAGTRVRPYFLCAIVPTACVRAGSWYVSDRRWKQIEDEVARETAAPVTTLNDRVADAATAEVVAAMPDRLARLWTEGVPLEGEGRLATWEERRQAVLSYWDSRTETAWGKAVREVIESFVRGEIQRSEHPYTAQEMAAFDASRLSVRPFPWTQEQATAPEPQP